MSEPPAGATGLFHPSQDAALAFHPALLTTRAPLTNTSPLQSGRAPVRSISLPPPPPPPQHALSCRKAPISLNPNRFSKCMRPGPPNGPLRPLSSKKVMKKGVLAAACPLTSGPCPIQGPAPAPRVPAPACSDASAAPTHRPSQALRPVISAAPAQHINSHPPTLGLVRAMRSPGPEQGPHSGHRTGKQRLCSPYPSP